MTRPSSWDLVPYFETWSIAALDVVCERAAHAVQHAKSLTCQISQIASVDAIPAEDMQYIIDEGDSVGTAEMEMPKARD
jgi:hypothetical protein